jgi:DNA-binding CsgD family transcriptional regulator
VRVPDTAPRPPRGLVPLSLVSLVVVLVTVGFAQGFWISNLHNGLLAVSFAGVGAYVLLERPGNREGALFMATGVVEAVVFLGRQTGHSSSILRGDWWGWLGVWPVVVALALTTFSVLCFPDGRLPSPHWRPVAVAVVAAAALCAALSALWPVEYDSAGLSTPHPVGASTPPLVQTLWSAVAHPAYVAFQALWVLAVALRWRSAGGHRRRQLAWLALAAGVSVAALIVGLAGWGSPTPGILSATLIPLAAGWAVVNGQRLASHSALTWLSRSGGTSADLPRDMARAVAEALDSPGATLWMGTPEHLHLVGVWPDTDEVVPPAGLTELSSAPGVLVRPVERDGSVVGAVAVRRPHPDPLSLGEQRLLHDLAAQAALVLAHQSLAGVVERQQRAGHLNGLSPREREVLRLVARGLSNAAICEELHLSIKTVEPLVSTVFTKLGLHPDAGSNRRVLAALAYERG